MVFGLQEECQRSLFCWKVLGFLLSFYKVKEKKTKAKDLAWFFAKDLGPANRIITYFGQMKQVDAILAIQSPVVLDFLSFFF